VSGVPSTIPEEVTVCPRCNIPLVRVVHVDAFGDQPGLDAYECEKCKHIMSRIREGQ
jgi:uncharacterized protein with PIN domain